MEIVKPQNYIVLSYIKSLVTLNFDTKGLNVPPNTADAFHTCRNTLACHNVVDTTNWRNADVRTEAVTGFIDMSNLN